LHGKSEIRVISDFVHRCIGIAFFFVGKTLSPAHPQLVKMERDIIMTRLSFLTTEVFFKKRKKKKEKRYCFLSFKSQQVVINTIR
jgi:hypothetical protein